MVRNEVKAKQLDEKFQAALSGATTLTRLLKKQAVRLFRYKTLFLLTRLSWRFIRV
jgi:hypothetical protein